MGRTLHLDLGPVAAAVLPMKKGRANKISEKRRRERETRRDETRERESKAQAHTNDTHPKAPPLNRERARAAALARRRVPPSDGRVVARQRRVSRGCSIRARHQTHHPLATRTHTQQHKASHFYFIVEGVVDVERNGILLGSNGDGQFLVGARVFFGRGGGRAGSGSRGVLWLSRTTLN